MSFARFARRYALFAALAASLCPCGFGRGARAGSLPDLGNAQLLIAGTRLTVEPEAQTVPFDTATIVKARLAIEGVLEVLPEGEREILRLRQLEGFSTREVAPRIGYRPASLRRVLARACRALRQAIESSAA